MLDQLVMILDKFTHSIMPSTITTTAISMTGTTNGKLKIVDLQGSLILVKKTPTLDNTLKIGLKILSQNTILTVLESIQFLKFPRTSGVSTVNQLEYSKWVSASMEIQLTLETTKIM